MDSREYELRYKTWCILEEMAFHLFIEAYHDFLRLLHEEELKAGFNPNQPRVPSGNPAGGQWTVDYGYIAEQHGWGKPSILEEHAERHGKDFNAKNARDYAKQAREFYQRGFNEKLPMVSDKSGNIRIYDPKTNTFGSYNNNGTTRTFYKPTEGRAYFERQIERFSRNGTRVINPLPPERPQSGRGMGGGARDPIDKYNFGYKPRNM